MSSEPSFLEELQKRRKTSRVYREYQLTGLEIAALLGDPKHKALYIRLAKEWPKETLFELAKDIVQRPRIRNRGAYFMNLLAKKKKTVKE